MFPSAHYQNMHAVNTSMMGVPVNPAMKKQVSVRWIIAGTLKVESAKQFLNGVTVLGCSLGGVQHARWNIVAKLRDVHAVDKMIILTKLNLVHEN